MKNLKNSRKKNKEKWLIKIKNIKISLKNVVDGFSCILDFSKFSGGGARTSLIKGIHQLNLRIFLQQQQQPKGKNELESPPPLKQSQELYL